ncbi:MAG: fused MFS/spermidine synthase [bacterium]
MSGAVLLALEIVASRVIAPFFGNSIYVWGSLIGVFLAALALGYFLGGVLADRWPSMTVLAVCVFLAGALVLLIPVVAPRLLESIILRDPGPRMSPLLGSLGLFFLPSVVMGMVSPIAVRLRARTVATIGNVAGALYALSTLGSIAGTLLASFVLIAVMEVSQIVYVLGATLLVLAVAGWVVSRRMLSAAVGAMVAVLLVLGVPFASPPLPEEVRFMKDTVYHRITVSDEFEIRYLKLDNYWQSGLDLADSRRTVFGYSDYLHLPLIFTPAAERVLVVGLGGGTVPARYHQDYPGMRIDVVELDPQIIAVAQRFFAVPSDSRLRMVAQDGRLFIMRAEERYDVILLDAYLIDTIPFHLATREFYETVKMQLSPGGVVGSNIIGALSGPRSGLFRAMYKTIREVFPTVYVFPVDWNRYQGVESLRNIIVVGTDRPRLEPREVLVAAERTRRTLGVTLPRFPQAAGDQYTASIDTTDVPVLTDDYAPVEVLIQGR